MSEINEAVVRKIIGANINKLLQEKKMSQKELACRSELDKAHLSRVINGLMKVRIETLMKIADALDTTLEQIVKGT